MPPPKVHDAALRDVLLTQTSRLVAEHGADAVSVRTVASAAGTSTSAVYALFGSRDHLLAAVAAEAVARFASHLAAVGQQDDPVARLLDLGRADRASALEDPHFYRVMFGAGTARLRAAEKDLPTTFSVLQQAAQRCIDSGRCAVDDAERMANTLWALVHGLVELELAGLIDGDPTDRAAAFDRALGDIWLGFAAR